MRLLRMLGPDLRHRVVAAFGQWMTPQNTPSGESHPPQHSMLGDGFYCILGTGRKEAAPGWKKRGYQNLVEAYHGNEQAAD